LIIPALHQSSKDSKWDQWIGHLSYPFYLVHQAVIDSFAAWNEAYKMALLAMLTLFISVCLTTLEARLFEPWRARLGRPTVGSRENATSVGSNVR
jgi:peptidoglycan/LPS O-acetylase OafA/YrhL